MERKYKKLSPSVIAEEKENGKLLYFTEVNSEASLRNLTGYDEAEYQVSAENIEVILDEKIDEYTDCTLVTFCEEDSDGKCAYMHMIISRILGTYISDWDC